MVCCSTFQVIYGRGDAVAMKEVPCEKDANLKSLHINILEIVARMTKEVLAYELTRLVGSVGTAVIDERDAVS